MIADADKTETILAAFAQDKQTAFVISGNGSKYFMADATLVEARALNMSDHSGIIDYEPTELMMKVRTGTRLIDINQQLAKEGQMLPFEALIGMTGIGTIGGAVSTGLAGPVRPWRGSVRDSVLGVTMISGQGQLLSFGGQVMKNVAGYDVSRLMTGAWGTLGVLTEVCLKLLPLPECTETKCFELDQQQALAWLVREQAKPWPFSGAAWEDGRLHIRLSGREPDVHQASAHFGGVTEVDTYWQELKDARRPPQMQSTCCIADVPPATDAHAGTLLLDWGGARRWFPGLMAAEVAEWVSTRGGSWRMWPGAGLALGGMAGKLQQKLKAVFDPANRCNPHVRINTS